MDLSVRRACSWPTCWRRFLKSCPPCCAQSLPAAFRYSSRIRILTFYPCRIQGSKKAPDPGSWCRQRHRWCTLVCEYLCQFSKKLERERYSLLRGLGETDSWKKNLKSKSRGSVPSLRVQISQQNPRSSGGDVTERLLVKSGSQGSAACGGQDKEKEEGEGLEDQLLHIQMKEVPSGEDSDGKLTVNCYQRC